MESQTSSDHWPRPSTANLIPFSVLLISVVSAVGDWLLVGPMKRWWMELGVQLSGLTISWLGPMWHLVVMAVFVTTALLMRIDGFQRKGFWLWLSVYAGWLTLTVLVLVMPMIKSGSLRELSS